MKLGILGLVLAAIVSAEKSSFDLNENDKIPTDIDSENHLNVEDVNIEIADKDEGHEESILIEDNTDANAATAAGDDNDHQAQPDVTEAREVRFFNENEKHYPNSEYLNIKPLKGNNVLFSFNFDVNSTVKLYPETNDILYYDVFPKSVGSILKSSNARELHVRFAHGWYDSELNGKLVDNGFTTGGTGVELWASIEANSKEKAFENWVLLANSLSGMFCSSFNFIDKSITTTPEKLFANDVELEEQVALEGNIYRFRSALPREPICTENLTPFLKLLPTKARQGISTLLSGNKTFNAEWSSMAIDVVTDCSEGDANHCQQSMKQSINMILNIPKILDRNEMPIPKPTPGAKLRCDETRLFDAFNCFPLPPSKELDFSFIDLFGKQIEGGSLLGSEPTKVCLDIDLDNWSVEMRTLAPVSDFYEDSKLCFYLTSTAQYNIAFNTKDASSINSVEAPPFYASRSLSGYSQDNGGFRYDLYNPGDEPQKIVIFETLPWFVRLYMHTLTVVVTDENGNTIKNINVNDAELSDYVKEIVYNPAIDRVAPTHFELSVEVPAHTKLKFTTNFDKAMLLYAEYPPDANHGFELQPTIFALIDDNSKVEYIMRTTTSLLVLPTPDFSMPYNVIILTLTIMSVTFGSIFNLLVKKTVTEEEAEKHNSERPLEKIKRKIRGILGK